MNDLDTLRPEVRKAFATVDFYFNDGAEWTGWPEVRAELLRLASENMELRGANKRMKFLLDSAEAELAALKARVAEAARAYHSSFEYTLDASTLYARATGIPGEETYALVKVEE